MTSAPNGPIRVYRHALSGHSHRVELFRSLLRLPYTTIDVDMKAGEHKSPAFLAKNPYGQVPVIEDGDVVVADSAAILVYLALKYDGGGSWLPRDPIGAAAVQRWLSFAAGPIASGPAAARLVNVFRAPLDLERAKSIADTFLELVDVELSRTNFAIGSTPTIADVAGYSYLAHAREGGISLEPYANVRSWIARVEALQNFIPMKITQVGLRA
jgi:glutathione S-transferase